MNIILCGLPRSGKTTFGKKIAKALKMDFIDTDILIENCDEKKRKCRQIVLEEGEFYFRACEKRQILSLLNVDKSVIALGGGALMDLSNQETIQTLGHLIYLKAPVEMLWSRLLARPAFLDPINPKQSFYDIAQMRIPIFESLAHQIIEVSLKESIPWEAILSELSLKLQPGENRMAKLSVL